MCVIACVSLSPVSGLCDNLIQDIIYSYLVLPNRITIPLVGEAQLSQLRFPIPKVGRDGRTSPTNHTHYAESESKTHIPLYEAKPD